MKVIEKLFKFIFTVDFVAVWIAIFVLSISISGWAAMLKPEKFGGIFKALFLYAVFSFTSIYLVGRFIEYFFLSNFPIKFMWLIVIILGSLMFTTFFQYYFSLSGSVFFFGYSLFALVPSATFRFTVNFAISYWQEGKINFGEISIIK